MLLVRKNIQMIDYSDNYKTK